MSEHHLGQPQALTSTRSGALRWRVACICGYASPAARTEGIARRAAQQHLRAALRSPAG